MVYTTTYHDQNIFQKLTMVKHQQWTVILLHSLLDCTVIFIQLLSSITVHSASTHIFLASPDSTSVFSISLLLDHFHHNQWRVFPFNIYFYHLVVPYLDSCNNSTAPHIPILLVLIRIRKTHFNVISLFQFLIWPIMLKLSRVWLHSDFY